ncbi:CLUMA_CG012158, isoform A [Clunio marinus]|uniref:CLUMA_CG012158, isoform A n=1 Tax=Clunio marinus TaxID=568069 RepID=A0A1J1IFX8_9DIPT|nr:CLUMA_CG012158, isoform A [Clunio marinus]
MSFKELINEIRRSNAAKALFWLLVALSCCIIIVVALDSLEEPDHDISPVMVEFAPRPNKGSIIYYKYKIAHSWKRWTSKIDHFLAFYKNPPNNTVECNFEQELTSNQSCNVDLQQFEPCINTHNTYAKASPCVFIKFNKVFDWLPQYYENLNETEFGTDFTNKIENNFAKYHPEYLQTVWVHCTGRTEMDTNLLGDVNYIPWMGFPGYFFPYKGQESYMEPLIAIQFTNPRVRIFLLILIVFLICVGVYILVRSSSLMDYDDETGSIEVIPKFDQGNFIRYSSSNRESILGVSRKIDEALKPYNSTSSNLYRGCNFYNHPPLGKTCDVDIKAFDPCSKERYFGYLKSTPCVFLKLSKDAEWVPEFYNESSLPEEMPEDLKRDVSDYVRQNKRHAQIIWVSCEGKSPVDKENMGLITYLPRRGFPGFYYPCSSKIACTEPLVAIQFQSPKSQVLINVQCTIWAKNLHKKVDFELQID